MGSLAHSLVVVCSSVALLIVTATPLRPLSLQVLLVVANTRF